MSEVNAPVIKWSGSKRSQAEQILKYFPDVIDTYYEPFCGGASVLWSLLQSNISVKHYVCSDINADLINLWNTIMEHPLEVYTYYKKHWLILNADNDIERKKAYFEHIRDKYNEEHDSLDFMFIMRTTTNGMPRYNRKGEFNNTYHLTRNGIEPERLKKILMEWSMVLNFNNVVFKTCTYEEIIPQTNDFLYLDPPYANTKGMYYGTIDYEKFWNWLRQLKCKYVLSFDGRSGTQDNTVDIPSDVYTEHKYLLSGNSSFRRIIGKTKDSKVYESLYVR